MTTRLEYYDPLYETIIFERGAPPGRGFHIAPAEGPVDPREVVQSPEFSRLAFMKQVGLAWLIFPSATHTRFAHSIGCWWLGRLAESLIKVGVETEAPAAGSSTAASGEARAHSGAWETHSLRWWLERVGLREEFYLGLLLHDIGHGPLSHVLEHNAEFIGALAGAGVPDTSHEARGATLLTGDGPLPAAWAEVVRRKYREGTRTLCDVRGSLDGSGTQVCLPAICYLMTGDARYREACGHSEHKSALQILKELISGVLDLDRLDHYARDSYFSGLRQVALNVQGFLANVRLRLPQREVRPGRWQMSLGGETGYFTLTEDGAAHAASLLFSKRQIVATMFRNSRSVALHAMANRALSLVLRGSSDGDRGAGALQIAMMQDDEFRQMLSASQIEECRYIARRLSGVDPYACVGKWSSASVSANRPRLRQEVERAAEKAGLVLYCDSAFWKRGVDGGAGREWLDTAAIMLDETGRPLTEHAEHRNDFAHLREAGQVAYLWAFASEAPNGKQGVRRLTELFSE